MEKYSNNQKLEEKGEKMKEGGSMRARKDQERRETQREAVIRLCKDQAYTIQELCDDMHGANYWAVSRVVKDLVDHNLLEELPFRQNRSILYQATGKIDQGVIKIQAGEALVPLHKIARLNVPDFGALFRGPVAYTWRRSWLKTQGDDGALQQSYILPVEAKKDLDAMRLRLKRVLAITDQVLLADIWNDAEGDHEKFGAVSTEEVTQLMEAAQKYMDSKKDPR